jgi:hypothetical protein
MRRDGDEAELMPQPGLDSLKSLAEEIGRAGLPGSNRQEPPPAELFQ